MTRVGRILALALLASAIAAGAVAGPALARGPAGPAAAGPVAAGPMPSNPVCRATGLVTGMAGTPCPPQTAASTGRLRPASIPNPISIGKTLVGGTIHTIGTIVAAPVHAAASVALAAIGSWVAAGARAALEETAHVIGRTTAPDLLNTWFSAAYWRVAGVSALLTLPFLFAAAIQALLRSDLTLLARAAFGYLPLGMLAVGVAGPLTMLLLAASDEMSTIVSSASGQGGASFLGHVGVLATGISVVARSPFVAFMVGLVTVGAAIALWLELLVREAAVYVIVLMLPLFFAAMVWPARRVWAVRSVELLVALILSKFAIVAVLALGGAALGHANDGVTTVLAGLTLVLLAAFTPWAVLRLLPLHELASAAASGMRVAPVQQLLAAGDSAGAFSAGPENGLQQMSRNLQDSVADDPGPARATPEPAASRGGRPSPDPPPAGSAASGTPPGQIAAAAADAAAVVAASGSAPLSGPDSTAAS
ncbi:MAG: hypothetical protein ACR2NR_02420, partial [Solirubrobacteraceae bacterium]